jgi:hypothetical protein
MVWLFTILANSDLLRSTERGTGRKAAMAVLLGCASMSLVRASRRRASSSAFFWLHLKQDGTVTRFAGYGRTKRLRGGT